MSEPIKTCVTCTHYICHGSGLMSGAMVRVLAECWRTETLDIVSGQSERRRCFEVRRDSDACGAGGAWWEEHKPFVPPEKVGYFEAQAKQGIEVAALLEGQRLERPWWQFWK